MENKENKRVPWNKGICKDKNPSKKKCYCGTVLKDEKAKYCSILCMNRNPERIERVNISIAKTKLERYGDSYYNNIQKHRETCLKKYGKQSFLATFTPEERREHCKFSEETLVRMSENKKLVESLKTPEEKMKQVEKFKQTLRDNPDIKKNAVKKFKKTLETRPKEKTLEWKRNASIAAKKYNSTLTEEQKKEISRKAREKYYSSDVQEKIIQTKLKNGTLYKSLAEKEIASFINELDFKTTTIRPAWLEYKEIDIFIQEKQFGIEFDGLFWHTEDRKGKDFHLLKTEACEKQGIQLLHIFENEWNNKKDIVKSIIRSKLNKPLEIYYARKCIIKEITPEESIDFLEKSHIQGAINGKFRLGLFYNNELVSLMLVGKSRFDKNIDFELLRFCSKLNSSVAGGFSRLLKYFEEKNPGSIISYADRRYSIGKVYEKNGFVLKGKTKPNYFYYNSYSEEDIKYLENRIAFQKHKLKDKLAVFDEKLTEWENMQINGYKRIYDCGNLVYMKK